MQAVPQPAEKPKPAKTTAEVSAKTTERIYDAYEFHRTENGLTSTSLEELKQSGTVSSVLSADYKNISVESATAFDNAFAGLISEYDTPLQRVRVMTKNEAMTNRNAFAFVFHEYTVDSAELVINPVKCKNYEALCKRIMELSENGYSVKIASEHAGEYVATHEFAHTLIDMCTPLHNSKNWLNADYAKIRKARKEIEEIFTRYVAEVQKLQSKRDAFNSVLYDFNSTLEQMEAAQVEWEAADDALHKVMISDYSLNNSDEFFAEAFTNERIGVKSNPYGKEIMKIVDTYFRR